MKLKVSAPQSSDWWSIGKGAIISAVAVALTYVSQHVTASDFGVYGPLVVGVISILTNIVQNSVKVEGDQ